jgi:hypothetical protein
MGVVKELLYEGQSVKDSNGNELNSPNKGQDIAMEYTGWLYDPTKPENKGDEYSCTRLASNPLSDCTVQV